MSKPEPIMDASFRCSCGSDLFIMQEAGVFRQRSGGTMIQRESPMSQTIVIKECVNCGTKIVARDFTLVAQKSAEWQRKVVTAIDACNQKKPVAESSDKGELANLKNQILGLANAINEINTSLSTLKTVVASLSDSSKELALIGAVEVKTELTSAPKKPGRKKKEADNASA